MSPEGRSGAVGQTETAGAHSPGLPPAPEAVLPSAQDPLQTWEYLLLHLRSTLRALPLTKEQVGRIAWHVKSRRYCAGDLIVKEGAPGDFWALVVRGTVAARSLSKSSLDRLAPAEPEVLVQAGGGFGENMLLHGQPSQCTYRAASDVELFVLRRADLISVMGDGHLPVVQGARERRISHLPAAFLLVLAVVAATWLGVRLRDFRAGVTASGRTPVQTSTGGESIRLIWPSGGAVIQADEALQVQVVATDAALDRIDLLVDGQVVGTQITADEAPGVRKIVLAWSADAPGSHTLATQGYRADGSLVKSGPVTITVVPAGRLVFSSNRSGSAAIYSMRSDGSEVDLLTRGPGECRQPSPRKDGAVAFVVEVPDRGLLIRTLLAGAEESVELFAGSEPAWSPGGDQLAFVQSVDGVSQVSVARVRDWTARQITHESVYAGQPAWSPDGKRLAYVAEREGNLDIWLVGSDSSESIRMTDGASTNWAPAWSPDGDHLAFVSDKSGQFQVYLTKVGEGAVAEQLTRFALGAEAPAWSPDGFWLAVVAYTGDGVGINAREIYLVRAEGGDPIRLTRNGYDDTHPEWVLP